MFEHIDRRELAAVAAGGAAGALLRVWIGRAVGGPGTSWPWATFAINVSGSLLLGYLLATIGTAHGYARPLLMTGFCGTFTTFSTMQVEILTMLERHSYGLALGYVCASVLAGYAAVWAGGACARRSARVLA
jgi:CrcB protein